MNMQEIKKAVSELSEHERFELAAFLRAFLQKDEELEEANSLGISPAEN